MTHYIGKKLSLFTMGVVACFIASSLAIGAGQTQADGVVFDKTSPSVHQSGKPPDYIYTELRRASPDGKYVAQLTGRDAEVAYVIIYRNRPHTRRLAEADVVSEEFADAHGCAWVPGHGHWLVISTGGADYGTGMIALWSGRTHVRRLLRAKSEDDEGFNVRSVSADGRALVYEHFGQNSPDPNDHQTTRLHLLLPRS